MQKESMASSARVPGAFVKVIIPLGAGPLPLNVEVSGRSC